MPDIEIKRGYEILSNNNIRFGIRVINNSDLNISDVEVILDQNESLFELEGNKIQNLGSIPPTTSSIAEFFLRPRGCIHKENIKAMIIFKDQQMQKHTLQMRPKEVHCIMPFLKEKYISKTEFLTMTGSSYCEELGMNFEDITGEKLVEILMITCRKKLHKVEKNSIENGFIIHLAGDVIGEKAYYLLTAVVKEYEDMTQIFLRANSNDQNGIHSFLKEIYDNLRDLSDNEGARETGIIKQEQLKNLIDHIEQRSSLFKDEALMNIKGEEQGRRGEKEGESKKEDNNEKEIYQNEIFDKDSNRIQGNETLQIIGKKKERAKIELKTRYSLIKNFILVLIISCILAVVYMVITSGPDIEQTDFIINEPNTVYVEIKGSKFNPAELRIVNGTKVIWTNMDSSMHIIRGDDFVSSELNKRDAWNYTFNKIGTFNYSCMIHQDIPQGKIIVTD